MRIKPTAAVIFSVIFVIAGILGSAALGWWQTTSNKIPPRLEVAALPAQAAAAGEAAPAGAPVDAGKAAALAQAAYDPAGIKGSFTFGEVAALYEVPLEDLADAFGVDRARAEGFKVKELETIYPKGSEVGTSSVRLFVAWYKGLPFTRKEESILPGRAVEILREKAALTQEQAEYLEGHTYPGE